MSEMNNLLIGGRCEKHCTAKPCTACVNEALRKEVERLTAEAERLSALADKWNFECDEMREDNKRLAAERDAALADAKRYQWLRSLEHCNEAWCLIGEGNANGNLDAAIDSAMKGEQP